MALSGALRGLRFDWLASLPARSMGRAEVTSRAHALAQQRPEMPWPDCWVRREASLAKVTYS